MYSDYVDQSIVKDSRILSTILAQTQELAFLQDWRSAGDSDLASNRLDLVAAMLNDTAPSYQGLFDGPPPLLNTSLQTTLQDLFQNLTVSLPAQPYLQ
jgi:hypothetical protein